jgi:hypothetical protein
MLPAAPDQRAYVVAHEVGQAPNLGHVMQRPLVMTPTSGLQADVGFGWTAGDVAGLQRLPSYSAC